MKSCIILPALILVALLVFPLLSANAQQLPPTQEMIAILDAFMMDQMDKHNLPGVAIAITQGEDIVYLNALGRASKDRPLTPRTPMYLGAATESFTALAILQIAERGLVDLNAPVRTYLPWFKVADESASAHLTINDFAHHASGLSPAGYFYRLPEDMGIAEAVRTLEFARLTQPVGQKVQYFNLNYTVLAAVIEAVSGQSYSHYIVENILQPLDMPRTYFSPEEAAANELAQGYSRFLGFTVPSKQPFREYELPTGGIISTARNMAHFVIAMNNDGRYGDAVVLSPGGMRALFASYPAEGPEYGIGWYIDSSHGYERLYNGGANEAFNAHMALFPERDLGLVVLVNQGYLLDDYTSTAQLFNGIEHILLTGDYPNDTHDFSMRLFNIGFVVFFATLVAYQIWQLFNLPTWRARVAQMAPAQRRWDIGLNFLIPTAILITVFLMLRYLFEYPLSLAQQLNVLFTRLPDVMLLCLVGTAPDYLQGIVKMVLLLTGRATRRAPI